MILYITPDKRTRETSPEIEAQLAALVTAHYGRPITCERYEVETTPEGAVLRAPPFARSCTTAEIGDALTALAALRYDRENAPPPEHIPSEWEIWQGKLDGGWTDTGEGNTGIKLKTTEAARNLFSGQVTMLREALDLGVISGDSQQSIWDYNEQEHLLTVTQLRGLLLRYGIAWKAMFSEFAP